MAQSACPPTSTKGKMQQEVVGGISILVNLFVGHCSADLEWCLVPPYDKRQAKLTWFLSHEWEKQGSQNWDPRMMVQARSQACRSTIISFEFCFGSIKYPTSLWSSLVLLKPREATTAVMMKVMRLLSMYIKSPCTIQSSPTWGGTFSLKEQWRKYFWWI